MLASHIGFKADAEDATQVDETRHVEDTETEAGAEGILVCKGAIDGEARHIKTYPEEYSRHLKAHREGPTTGLGCRRLMKGECEAHIFFMIKEKGLRHRRRSMIQCSMWK